MRSRWIWLLLVVGLLAVGCASGEVKVDHTLLAQVESLPLKPGMTRAQVIEEMGSPAFIYEQDRVISFPMYVQYGKLFKKKPDGGFDVVQLMVKFSLEWRLERTSLVPRDNNSFSGPNVLM